MTRFRFSVLALALGVLAACGGPQVPPAANYGTITGRVFDAATNQPIPGVVVTVDTILNGTSGSDGTYRVTNIPLGTYTLRPNPPSGYTAPLQPAYDGSIGTGQTITVDVPLTKR
ncbi:MAG TPA: carboxypeptidase regulatory-like domain-containing protein [Candidatus Elarobacter sp.]|nr:carboxypeptidase regulatory-like domain-containing protein [Candidatus Elarobacter sp.]